MARDRRNHRGRVHRAEDLLRGRSLRVEVEVDRLADPEQPVVAARQADPVGLEPMTQPRLDDAAAVFELVDQAMQVVMELRIEVVHVSGDDTAEQDAAEAGRRIGRQRALAERQASSG